MIFQEIYIYVILFFDSPGKSIGEGFPHWKYLKILLGKMNEYFNNILIINN
jgi:hypothetical protein